MGIALTVFLGKRFIPDRAKSKIDKFSENYKLNKLKNKQHHSKVMLNSFLKNGYTAHKIKTLETFVSPEVSLCESKDFYYHFICLLLYLLIV